ncbi:MAG TPA: SCO family protein [Acetobacteraceae bacterium]|nr:SCO family protein [Acetobacteraceae bacterium]
MLWLAGLGLALAAALFGVGLYLWFSGQAGASIGGPFSLIDQSGRRVSAASFRGKYMLVYFGYTYCPDVCPTTLTDVAGALDKLGPKADAIVPIFITVDPQRDTPEVLKTYVAAFSPRIIGLTGTPAEIDQAEREYHVYAAKHVTGPGPNDYAMDHSSFLYLMGPDGRFITPIDSGASADELAQRLDQIVRPTS